MPPDAAVLTEAVHARLLADRSSTCSAAGHGLRPHVESLVRDSAPLLAGDALASVVDGVVARTVGLGPLEPLLADPSVSEVMLNGPGRVWVERAGRVVVTDVVVDRPTVELLVERAVAPAGLRADRTAPLVDCRLPDGSRVNVVMPPLAVDGPYLTIRRFGARAIPLAAACSPAVAALLSWAVRARLNVLVSGGTEANR